MHPLKTLGPYGFQGIFYRHYCDVVGENVIQMVQDCFHKRAISKCFNKTFIVLIPNVQDASNFSQFWPISLCNFSYKIVSKIVVNRLIALLPKIISLNQGAFVEGCWIAENMVIPHELAHKVKKHKRKSGMMLLKVYMRKAYDQMEWKFIRKMLRQWGFSEDVSSMIMSCITSVEYNLLINDSKNGMITPRKGLRQGDPLSFFIFILCAEIFSRLV